MGRGSGGSAGASLQHDIDTGQWREMAFQVTDGLPPNSNWFTVDDFLQRLAEAGQLEEDPVHAFRASLQTAIVVLARVAGEGSVATGGRC